MYVHENIKIDSRVYSSTRNASTWYDRNNISTQATRWVLICARYKQDHHFPVKALLQKLLSGRVLGKNCKNDWGSISVIDDRCCRYRCKLWTRIVPPTSDFSSRPKHIHQRYTRQVSNRAKHWRHERKKPLPLHPCYLLERAQDFTIDETRHPLLRSE